MPVLGAGIHKTSLDGVTAWLQTDNDGKLPISVKKRSLSLKKSQSTSWNEVFENLTVAAAVKIFLTFYGIRRFITVLTQVIHNGEET
jgi:hypothetical protein